MKTLKKNKNVEKKRILNNYYFNLKVMYFNRSLDYKKGILSFNDFILFLLNQDEINSNFFSKSIYLLFFSSRPILK